MAEIIDCSKGLWEDADYAYFGKKPPKYSDEEWEKIINRKLDADTEKELRELYEDALKIKSE